MSREILTNIILLAILITGCTAKHLIPPTRFVSRADCPKCNLSDTHKSNKNLVPNNSFENHCALILGLSTQLYDFTYVCNWNKDDSLFGKKSTRAVTGTPVSRSGEIIVMETVEVDMASLFLGTPDYFVYDPSVNDMNETRGSDSISYVGINLMGVNGRGLMRGCEYIQISLMEELVKDSVYEVGFDCKIKLEIFGTPSYPSNVIGLKLSDTLIYAYRGTTEKDLRTLPEAYRESVMISDSVLKGDVWHELRWTYKSKGGEKFLLIGDVRRDNMIFEVPDPDFYDSYYLIDNVQVRMIPSVKEK